MTGNILKLRDDRLPVTFYVAPYGPWLPAWRVCYNGMQVEEAGAAAEIFRGGRATPAGWLTSSGMKGCKSPNRESEASRTLEADPKPNDQRALADATHGD